MKISKTFYNKDNRLAPGAPASGRNDQGVVKLSPVNACCFSPSPKYFRQLATVDEAGKLVIWDAIKA